jgi:hypothetical protein
VGYRNRGVKDSAGFIIQRQKNENN